MRESLIVVLKYFDKFIYLFLHFKYSIEENDTALMVTFDIYVMTFLSVIVFIAVFQFEIID